MSKLLFLLCFTFYSCINCVDAIQLDGIDYDMIPVMMDEHQTSSLEEMYYCGPCMCDDCLKERH